MQRTENLNCWYNKSGIQDVLHVHGTLRIGEVTETEDSFSVQWTESKMFAPGNYAYSCLSDMGEGIMGLLYEKANTIKFTSFPYRTIFIRDNLWSPECNLPFIAIFHHIFKYHCRIVISAGYIVCITCFPIDFIKSEVNLLNPRITSVSYDVVKETEHESTLPGDTYMFTANMDQNVIPPGLDIITLSFPSSVTPKCNTDN